MSKTRKIEKGIAAPQPRVVVSRLGDLSAMEVGDSIVVETQGETNSFRGYWYLRGYKANQRKLPDGRYRVWKGDKRSL